MSVKTPFYQDMAELVPDRDAQPVILFEKRYAAILDRIRGGLEKPILLVGTPGIGRSTFAYGFVKRLKEHNPKQLDEFSGYRIINLNMPELQKNAENAEKEIAELLTLLKVDPKSILFIKGIWPLLGLDPFKGAMSARLATLSSQIQSGKIHCIGTLSNKEFIDAVKINPSFAENFECIDLHEPNENESLCIMVGMQSYLERKHGLRISPNSLNAVVKLCAKYMPDKTFPKKAIDVLEKACTRYKGKIVARDRFDGAMLNEQSLMQLRNEVSPYDVMKVIEESEKVNIGSSVQYLRHSLTQIFTQTFPGQSQAISSMVDTVVKVRTGFRNPLKPAGFLLLCGPAKTEKYKAGFIMAKYVMGDDGTPTIFDMEEYKTQAAAEQFLSHGNGKESLYQAVGKSDYNVIVLRNIESAHELIIQKLLYIAKTARLDCPGHESVSCQNTLFVTTMHFHNVNPAVYTSTMVLKNHLRSTLDNSLQRCIDTVVLFMPN